MDDSDLFLKRHSCRSYTADRVPSELVERLLEAACWAPSGGNLQPWRFVVVTDDRLRAELARTAFGQAFIGQAPVVIAVCAVPEESARHYGSRGRELYCLQDSAAATENLLLAATAAGLGSCWVGAFDEPAVARVLDLPDDWRPVALVSIGRPADGESRRSRRPLDEVVVWRT
jgi:nitroreductase